MKKYVFRVEVEVTTMEGSTLPDDWQGAFVNVLIGEDSIIDAIQRVEEALVRDKYRPLMTCAAFMLELEDYANEDIEEGYPDLQELEHLRRNGGVWYGPFYGFTPDVGFTH